MKDFLLQLLVDPSNRSALTYDATDNTLYETSTGNRYEIKNEVPILLSAQAAPIDTADQVHKDHQTQFDYQEHYQKDAEVYDYFKHESSAASNNEHKRLHKEIERRVPKHACIILDIGCGGAWVAKRFLPKGMKVISTDISTINPIKALQKYPHKNHAAMVADAFNLPLQEGSVDCIIASEIMEHVPDPKKFIASLYQALRPGGRLIITTPYDEDIEYSLCVHCNRPTPRHAHLHSFSEANIGQYIPEAVKAWRFDKFNNKYLVKLRSHIILQFLPHVLWKLVDKKINKMVTRPLRFLLEIDK